MKNKAFAMEILPTFIAFLLCSRVCLGTSSIVSFDASPSSLRPSFDKDYGSTNAIISTSAATAIKTDELSTRASLIETVPTITESHNDSTCGSTKNASALRTAYEMQRLSTLEKLEFSQHTLPTVLVVATDIQSVSISLHTKPNVVLSAHISDVGTKLTNSSNGATTDQTSYIFALVFGIFGGILVLGIGVMMFKNMYTKSKNRVKKIKRKKGEGV